MKPNKESIILAFILLLAALLRFWHIGFLEYSYDELSAIFRSQFNTFHDLIEKGVKPDGHPAGVQTFIWLIGDHVTLLKSLAAAAGVGAVYFTFKAGKSLFNPAAGLVAAALLAVLYLPVFWSQQIRPYAFGMLFSSALLFTWSEIVFHNRSWRDWMWFILLATLSAYTHYFAGLFAILLWISGFALGTKKQRKLWILSAVAMLLLFLPHFPITVSHLHEGGLGWLGKPSIHFFWQHIFKLFGTSMAILLAASLIAGLSYFISTKAGFERKKVLLLFFLFITPLCIGYIYSIFRTPVLQHSVLLFSTPPLLILIGYIISAAAPEWLHIKIAAIAAMGVYVLIYNNQHYSIGYKEPYSSMVKQMRVVKTSYVVDAPKDVFAYYIKKYDYNQSIQFRYLQTDSSPYNYSMPKLIAIENREMLVLSSGSDPSIIPIYEDYCRAYRSNNFSFSWIGGEIPIFGAPTVDTLDSNSGPCNKFPIPWTGKPIEIELTALHPNKNDVIVVTYLPDSSYNTKAEIQTALLNRSQVLDWRSTSLATSLDVGLCAAYHVIKLADIPNWRRAKTLSIKVEGARGGAIRIRVSKGNPYLYGID